MQSATQSAFNAVMNVSPSVPGNVFTINGTKQWIGDHKWVPGEDSRTWIPGGYQTDWGRFTAPWIGDFPPVLDPLISPVVPNVPYGPIGPQRNAPNEQWIQVQGNSTQGYITLETPPQWRTTRSSDRIVAAIDVPGMKIEDLNVTIDNGSVLVTGTRFDTGGLVTLHYNMGIDYDPETASAVLEAGVLTVTVMRFKERSSRRVPVTAK